jgi:hypothetical protein
MHYGFDGPDPEYIRDKHRRADQVPFHMKVIMGIFAFLILALIANFGEIMSACAAFVSRLL